MKLIKKLGTRKNKNGTSESWGFFWCEGCEKEVEKPLSHGKRCKSCGCKRGDLISKAISGKNHPMYGKHPSEETKQKISDSGKGRKISEEQKQQHSERMKGKNNPMYGKIDELSPNFGKHTSEETRNKISLANKGKKHTEKARQKMSEVRRGKNYGIVGDKHWNWNNGSSFLPYAPEFNKELKQQVLERDNYICQDPNCEHKTDIFHIHHIDYDKKNNSLENLTTLCISCHMKTNTKNKRQFFTEFYQNIMLNRLIECLL